MSVRCMSWVFENSPESVAGRRLVLLVLADKADHDGTNAYPSVATIAREARLSERGVRYALRELEKSGAIIRRGLHPQYGTNEYVVVMGQYQQGAQNAPGQTTTDSVSQIAPEPSLEPSVVSSSALEAVVEPSERKEPSSSTSVVLGTSRERTSNDTAQRERKLVRYHQRVIPDQMVSDAQWLLSVFAVAVGRSIPAWTRAGDPTPELKRVIGGMKDRDGVTVDEWARAIHATVADPPDYLDGPLRLGDVFGDKAAERALALGRGERGQRRTNGNGRTRWTPEEMLAIGQEYEDVVEGTAHVTR